MLFAIYDEWGTHYELGPRGMPEMSPFVKWIAIGLIPQMTAWIAYTAVFGTYSVASRWPWRGRELSKPPQAA